MERVVILGNQPVCPAIKNYFLTKDIEVISESEAGIEIKTHKFEALPILNLPEPVKEIPKQEHSWHRNGQKGRKRYIK